MTLTKQQIEDMRTSLGLGANPFSKDAIDSLCALAVKSLSPEARFGTWIDVKDKLPENTQTMLVNDCRDGRCIGYYVRDISGWVKVGEGDRLYEVTHWTPLPGNPLQPQREGSG